MNYLSASYINVKLKQDYADFQSEGLYEGLIICDGVGEFSDSDKVSQTVVNTFFKNEYKKISELIKDNDLLALKDSQIQGGTTIITAFTAGSTVKIEYLGNGGILHLAGDFARNPSTSLPYRFASLMLPHISPSGILNKHLSHTSSPIEWKATEINLSLNHINGDIVLFFTDGISSIEDNVILQDDEKRFWRHENSAIQFILKELDIYLSSSFDSDSFQDTLIEFNRSILEKLKEEDYLEDDASLGIILTQETLDYYKSVSK